MFNIYRIYKKTDMNTLFIAQYCVICCTVICAYRLKKRFTKTEIKPAERNIPAIVAMLELSNAANLGRC